MRKIVLVLTGSLLLSSASCAHSSRAALPDPTIPHRVAEEAEVVVWVRLADGSLVKAPVRLLPGWWIAGPPVVEPMPAGLEAASRRAADRTNEDLAPRECALFNLAEACERAARVRLRRELDQVIRANRKAFIRERCSAPCASGALRTDSHVGEWPFSAHSLSDRYVSPATAVQDPPLYVPGLTEPVGTARHEATILSLPRLPVPPRPREAKPLRIFRFACCGEWPSSARFRGLPRARRPAAGRASTGPRRGRRAPRARSAP
jgi:hypothetical protein